MPKFYVVHRKDDNNVGDIASNPLQYFLKDNEYETVDIVNLGTKHFKDGVPVIAGGGGLIGNEFMEESLRDLLTSSDKTQLMFLAQRYWQESSAVNKPIRDDFFQKLNRLVKEYADKIVDSKSPRILWGAGHNGNYHKKLKGPLNFPTWLRDFDEVGIRDYNQEHTWSPCASCMHPALRERYKVKNNVIWFEHKKQLIKSTEFGSDPIPRFINSGNNIEQTISILGSANIIITNSYHGAYWGTLLGKKVIVVEPWSSKFNAMKHAPRILGKGEYWRDFVDDTPTYPHALDECITATQDFWNNVKGYAQ